MRLLLAALTMLTLIAGGAARVDEPPNGFAAAWRVDALFPLFAP